MHNDYRAAAVFATSAIWTVESAIADHCYNYLGNEPLADFILDTMARLRLERNSGPISSLVSHYVAHGRLPDTSDPDATAAILPK